MKLPVNRPARMLALALCFLMPVANGCAAVQLARGARGTDVSAVQIGAPRQEVETAIGEPVRQWQDSGETHLAVYEFSGDIEPQYGTASLVLLLDILTLFLLELVVYGHKERHPNDRLLVAYDSQGEVIGLMDEYDIVPEDGRSSEPPRALKRQRSWQDPSLTR